MNCQECGRHIEGTIDGKQLCVACCAYAQLDERSQESYRDFQDYVTESKEQRKCPDCGRHSDEIGWSWEIEDVVMECPSCGMWQLYSREVGVPAAAREELCDD